MRAFDARCLGCGQVHVVWVAWHHDSGDCIRYAHSHGRKACGEYVDHELIATLDGVSEDEKWGPPDDAASA